ncbi:MAG: response regulator, partial [Clostridia bacterium]|nr:response regulator [Clostridia bacterium]
LSIINNVLEMTRIEQGAIEVDETPAGVEQFTDGIESMFGGMMEAKGIEFIADIRVKHMFVYCDVGKTRELFMNVLSNACKFTNPGGKVKMILEEFPGESNDRVYFRTTISDTGIGMEEEFIPHMFDAFARENNTTDAKVEGTGLGMPIVKRLVDLMHGTIDVKSKKDFGTQVTITIPHRIAKEEDCLTQVDKTIDPELFRGRRILLAEDNDLNAEIAIEILREAGFIIEHAGDGKECYDMLTSADDDYYDIVLMDIQMPNMNGYEAAVAIRKMHSKKKSEIPIVAMTANAFEEDKKEAFRCGMNGHIAKPINVKNVLEQLARIIRQKQ